MRVIHVPTVTGGNPPGLSKALNVQGIASEVWDLSDNPYGYAADVTVSVAGGLLRRQVRKLLSLRYIFYCDVAFFNYGSGVFSPFPVLGVDAEKRWSSILLRTYRLYSRVMASAETWLLRLLRKPIFIQYQGDDARQSDYCLQNFEVSHATALRSQDCSNADHNRRQSIAFYSGRVSKIYALNPDLLRVLPSKTEFLPYSHVSINDLTPTYTQVESRPLRIGHAPTNRSVKGTELVCFAVNELKRRGYQFEFVLVERVSRDEAMAIYQTLDVLVDQLFVGWYGGVAVEAMAMGKPVISYIRQSDLALVPKEMCEELPVIQASPATFAKVLQSVVEMPRRDLRNIGVASRAYAERWHDPVKIAARVKADIERVLKAG